MNNEFRVWSNKSNKFLVEPRLSVSLLNCCAFVCSLASFDGAIQNSIGVTDQRGISIFEGDIIENQAGRRFIIEYVNIEFVFREIILSKDGDIKSDYICDSIGALNLCRIVGNIFEGAI